MRLTQLHCELSFGPQVFVFVVIVFTMRPQDEITRTTNSKDRD